MYLEMHLKNNKNNLDCHFYIDYWGTNECVSYQKQLEQNNGCIEYSVHSGCSKTKPGAIRLY